MIPSCGQCELHWQPQAFVERIAESGITAAFARDWQNLCDTSLKQGCWPVVAGEISRTAGIAVNWAGLSNDRS